MSSPSAPLLRVLRDVIARRKVDSGALARTAGVKRSRLKRVLSGAEPLTVDELMLLSQALELQPTDLAGVIGDDAPAAAPVTPIAERVLHIEHLGNQAEQMLKLGLGLRCDIMLSLDSEELGESGIPADVIRRFPREVPIRLESAFHRHHNPRFLPAGLAVTLSFDSLYECTLPWAAIRHVVLFPAPWDPESEPVVEETPARGHLRLVT